MPMTINPRIDVLVSVLKLQQFYRLDFSAGMLSICLTISFIILSGFVMLLYLATTLPSWLMRNFSKFHFIWALSVG
jgi:hypothetical protein